MEKMSKKLQEIILTMDHGNPKVEVLIHSLDQLIEEAEEELSMTSEEKLQEIFEYEQLTDDQMVEVMCYMLGYMGMAESSNQIIRDKIREFIHNNIK